MSNLSVQSQQVAMPVSQTKAPAAPAAQQAPSTAPAASGLAKDAVLWKDVPTSSRVKTATTLNFKQTVIPYTIGGALAAPAAGAVLGGFIGLFAGTPGKGALEGAKAAVRFAPYTAAVGLAASGVESVALGTVVGTAPDRQSAATRAGVASAVIGILSAEKPSDLINVGIGTAASTSRAARLFDKTEAALQNK